MPNFRALTSLVALYSQSSETWICGHCHEFQIALNQANQKKHLPNFLTLKNPGIIKSSNPKISFDNPRNLKSGVSPPRASTVCKSNEQGWMSSAFWNPGTLLHFA